MQILVDIVSQDWISQEDIRAELAGIPDREIRMYPEFEDGSKIRMLVCDRLRPGLASKLPNLELIQKLGAGVDTMLSDPDLPGHIRIARLKHAVTAMCMARFCLAYVLNDIQNVDFHRLQQRRGAWVAMAPKPVEDLVVAVLGLGHTGGTAAAMFANCGFRVSGWSRTTKNLDGITCSHGSDQLNGLLGDADYVLSILPSTPETENLFDLDRFRAMKPESLFINVGRGTLVVEDDLVEALDNGFLRHAVLDVCRHEPLPEESTLWHHPGITITPHVSGWYLDDGFDVVPENYRRLEASEPLLHEIDRQSGY